jgi:uncharacterized protein (DUF1778 family)
MGRPKDPNAKRERLDVRITKEQKDKLKNHAEKKGKSISKAVEEILDNLDSE